MLRAVPAHSEIHQTNVAKVLFLDIFSRIVPVVRDGIAEEDQFDLSFRNDLGFFLESVQMVNVRIRNDGSFQFRGVDLCRLCFGERFCGRRQRFGQLRRGY